MIVVNPSTRQFNIPGADLVFGVESDSGSVRKYFQCPRHVGNNLDLAASFIRMNYRNANGEIDSYLVEDVAVDGENVTFSWLLSPKTTMYKGQLSFVMCVVGPDTMVQWHTTIGRGQVLEGLEPDSAVAEEGTADAVAQLIEMVEAQTAAVEKTGADQVTAVKTAAKDAQDSAVASIETAGVAVKASIPTDYTALSDAMRAVAPGIECSVEGEVITLNDASNQALRGMKIFGRSTQDGIPTPENPVEIVSIENPTISVGEQTVSIPRTLCGIPVTSGGNYTDENGQQWICDEVDFERGMYVQMVTDVKFDGDEGWVPFGAYNGLYRYYCLVSDAIATGTMADQRVMCSSFPTIGVTAWSLVTSQCIALHPSDKTINLFVPFAAVDEFKAYLAYNPMIVIYQLATPNERPLSEPELAAYRALHTNKPNTTILNDSGAHMKVDYTADTRLYIDNKIAALMGS